MTVENKVWKILELSMNPSLQVIERTQEINIQEQEIMRREKELDSSIRRPAEAEKFRLEKIAEATR
jgi:flotillin